MNIEYRTEKTFSLISEYECTDQVHICLEAIYKCYLALSREDFLKMIDQLPVIFSKQQNSQICRF